MTILTATERVGEVTFKGQPLTLVGPALRVGEQAPEAAVVDSKLNEVEISSFLGKPLVLSSVPSLDTPVCSIETRRFNQEAQNMGNVPVLTVSMDLPFAQSRWCAAEGIKNVITLSDWRYAQFGMRFGVLIKELHLLARTIFVLDRDGKITYIQRVKEIAQEPDYNAVLAAVKQLGR